MVFNGPDPKVVAEAVHSLEEKLIAGIFFPLSSFVEEADSYSPDKLGEIGREIARELQGMYPRDTFEYVRGLKSIRFAPDNTN